MVVTEAWFQRCHFLNTCHPKSELSHHIYYWKEQEETEKWGHNRTEVSHKSGRGKILKQSFTSITTMEREKQNYRLAYKWAAIPLPTWLNNLVLCAWRSEAFALQVNSWLNRWEKRPGAVGQGSHAHSNHRHTWGEEGHNRKHAHQLRGTEKGTSAWLTTLAGTRAWSSTLLEILLVRGKGRCCKSRRKE